MRLLVIGGGAREHALVWKLAGERGVHEVICAPGNPGMLALGRCVPVDLSDPANILGVADSERVDLTVIGPEQPLSSGVVDLFHRHGLAILGPTKAAATLESSKVFAKDFMTRHAVPTARFEQCDSAPAALQVIASGRLGYPLVVKVDGLAAGKGVVIATDRPAAEAAVRAAMIEQRFGDAGARVVLEEFLVGEEVSYFVLTDGVSIVPFGSAQDHKRLLDDDKGPNTGGMGAFAPSVLMTPSIEERVLTEIVRPVLAGMAEESRPFCGFLFVGLMLTLQGPRVVEFNVRFGDPEAQVIFPMLDEDLSTLLAGATRGELPSRPVRFRPEPHVGVVLASEGYPDASSPPVPIDGLDRAERVPDARVFQAGTARRDGRLVTAGGRVLTVVGRGSTHASAVAAAYSAVSHISIPGMQYRRDIGARAVHR